MADSSLLDRHNRLNGYGKEKYWQEVDRNIELFERRCISLRRDGHRRDRGLAHNGSGDRNDNK